MRLIVPTSPRLDAELAPASLRRRLLTEPRRPAGVRASPRAHWYVVGMVCIGAFIGQLDASIVTLTLPRLSHELNAGVGVVEWVALTYLLVLVASVATVGRIADAVGRKLLYVYGFGVFTAGSALCGLAPTDRLIELSIFRWPELSLGLSSGLISYLVLFGTLFVVPYYLSASHAGAARAGLQLAVLPAAIAVAAPVAGRLLNRVGHRPLTAGGMILAAIGLLEIALWPSTPGLPTGLALAGLGLGAFTPANNATIMSAAPAGHTGVVSGVLNMTRGMGTALGVALASALYLAAAGASGNADAAHGLTAALAVLACLALGVGLTLMLDQARRTRHRERVTTTCSAR